MKKNEIIRKIERLRGRLAAIDSLLKGSVSPVRLGPRKTAEGERVAYLLTYKGSLGKTKSVYLRKGQIPEVQRMIRRYQQAKQILEDLVEMNVALFKIRPK